jgi:AraC family transcriptional regulator
VSVAIALGRAPVPGAGAAPAAPAIHVLHAGGGISVIEYVCHATRHSPVVTEFHDEFRLALVRRGSFGYHAGPLRHELSAGAVLLGTAGQEYVCTHEHGRQGGDECLAFSFCPEVLDDLAGRRAVEAWRVSMIPPNARLMVLGALADARLASPTGVSLEETALEIAAAVIEIAGGRSPESGRRSPSHADRRRVIRSAERIAAGHADGLDLGTLAAEVGLSRFHFLRLFSSVLGVTPHQYLLRVRLERAARLLAEPERPITEVAYAAGFRDLSRFIRTFRAAAGVPPGLFRKRVLQV